MVGFLANAHGVCTDLTSVSAALSICGVMSSVATQRLQFFVAKFESERARQELCDAAVEEGLAVDAVTGGRGLLGYRLRVTVTGAPERIESFHRKFEGDGWPGSGGSDIAQMILSPILAGLLGGSQRSLAGRLRRKKLERAAVKGGPAS